MEKNVADDIELERRLALVERPEYERGALTRSDYARLFLVAAGIPLVLLIVGWSL